MVLSVFSVAGIAGTGTVAAQTGPTVTVSSPTTSPGSTVTVTLNTANIPEAAGTQGNLTFNGSVLDVASITTTFGSPIANVNNASGFVSWTASQPTNKSNIDPLVTIEFVVDSSAQLGTDYPLTLQSIQVFDENSNNFGVTPVNGNITIPNVGVDINDQLSQGNSVELASYALGPDGTTVAVWSVDSAGNPDEVLGSVSPSAVAGGPITISLSPALSSSQTVVAAIHNGTPTTANILASDTANITVRNFDTRLVDNGTFWIGQTLLVEDSEISPGETLQVRTDNSANRLVDEPVAGSDARVTYDTGDLSAGNYRLLDGPDAGGRVEIASFEVVPQNLDINFASGTVANAGDSTSVDLQFDSNRGSYTVIVSSPGLQGSELQSILGMGTVTANDNLRVSINGDEALAMNFNGIPAGRYNVTAEVTDTGVSDTASVQVNSPGAITANFAQATVQEERGDMLSFTVNMQNTRTAVLTVGSASVGYRTTMTLEDTDGDGSVTVMMNTFTAGRTANEGTVYSAASGGAVTNVNRTTGKLTSPLAVTTGGDSYSLTLSVGGEEKDVGSIFLNGRSTDSIQVWTAPASASPSSVSGLLSVVTQRSEVADGDWVVFQVQASGLYAYLQDKGSFGSNGLSFTVTQTNPGLNADPVTLNTSGPNAAVFTDAANDTFYLAVKLVANDVQGGQQFQATFGIDGASNPLVTDAGSGLEESVSASFSVTRPGATIDQRFTGTGVVVPSSSSTTISGTSTLAPGTEITVTVQSTSGENPYLRRNTATVQEDGTWSTTFDTSGLPAGTGITVNVNARGTSLTGGAISGEIGEPPEETVQTRTVIRTVTRTVEQEVTRTVTRTVVQTQEVTRTVQVTRTVTVTTGGQPGFGIAVAIAALLAAALLALRRRD